MIALLYSITLPANSWRGYPSPLLVLATYPALSVPFSPPSVTRPESLSISAGIQIHLQVTLVTPRFHWHTVVFRPTDLASCYIAGGERRRYRINPSRARALVCASTCARQLSTPNYPSRGMVTMRCQLALSLSLSLFLPRSLSLTPSFPRLSLTLQWPHTHTCVRVTYLRSLPPISLPPRWQLQTTRYL